MTLEMFERETLLRGREEGREEGRVEGREEGRAESVRTLMESLQFTAAQAMDALRIPEQDRSRLLSLL